MRMRFKPYARAELMASDFHVHEPLTMPGLAPAVRPAPAALYPGAGLRQGGGFISQLACAHPENNYLGIDITDKVLIPGQAQDRGCYAAAGRPVDNVKIMSTDIERIRGVIAPEDTVQRITSTSATPGAKTPPPTSTGSPTPGS